MGNNEKEIKLTGFLAEVCQKILTISPNVLRETAFLSIPGGIDHLAFYLSDFIKNGKFDESAFISKMLTMAIKHKAYQVIVIRKIKKGLRIDHGHVLGESVYFMPLDKNLNSYGLVKRFKIAENGLYSHIALAAQAYGFDLRNN